MIGAIYARYSSDNQRPESIEDQIRACTKFAEKNKIITIPDMIYTDEAISGTKADRVGLNELLIDANQKKFDVVIVDDLSRFSRSIIYLLKTINEFEYLGIRLLSVTENIDTGAKGAKLSYQLKGMFNEIFLDDLKEKTLRGLVGQKERGYFLAEAP